MEQVTYERRCVVCCDQTVDHPGNICDGCWSWLCKHAFTASDAVLAGLHRDSEAELDKFFEQYPNGFPA